MTFLKYIPEILLNSEKVHSVFLGGSLGKCFFDEFSDLDIGVIVDNFSDFTEIFEKMPWKPDFIEKKEHAMAYHFWTADQKYRLEFRVMETKTFFYLREKIENKTYLGNIEQDLLYNVKNGKYLKISDDFKMIKSQLNLTSSQKIMIYQHNAPLIRDYGFEKIAKRKDFTLFDFYSSIVVRAFYNIAFSANDLFFMGYKHEIKFRKKLENVPIKIFEMIDRMQLSRSYEEMSVLLNEMELYFKSQKIEYGK